MLSFSQNKNSLGEKSKQNLMYQKNFISDKIENQSQFESQETIISNNHNERKTHIKLKLFISFSLGQLQ